MGTFGDSLKERVNKVIHTTWETRTGTVVPSEATIPAKNYAVELDAVILYADLAKSTQLVKDKTWWFAGEVYKTFLECSALCIKRNGGTIVSFDGDRIMAVYLGDGKENKAATTGRDISHAVNKIINPRIAEKFPKKAPDKPYEIKYGIGIDATKIYAAKVGVRNDNDLVWIGEAANRAAKFCDMRRRDRAMYISKAVYNKLDTNNKMSGDANMWESFTWAETNETIYFCTYMTTNL